MSAISLLEIAALFGEGSRRVRVPIEELFAGINSDNGFQIVPIDIDIATEVAALGKALSDPADRAIVATDRVHRLRLVTSDLRIIESKLVPVLD